MSDVFTAKLKSFDMQKGFGFIEIEGQKDLFLHKRNLRADSKPEDLTPGMTVSFSVREQAGGGKKGKKGKGKGVSYAKLKGSVGEGPNQTNYSDRSSVRILNSFKIQEFSLEKLNSNTPETFEVSRFSKMLAKF